MEFLDRSVHFQQMRGPILFPKKQNALPGRTVPERASVFMVRLGAHVR